MKILLGKGRSRIAHGGGPVRQTLSAMSKPMYWVGEKGPEKYVPKQGMPRMVGMAGPEVRSFPEDGYIVPNDELGMMGNGQPSMGGGPMGGPGMGGMAGSGMWGAPQDGRMMTLSKMADGTYGMGGGMNYGIPGRAEGGPVEGDDPRNIEQWGWVEGSNGEWTHPETEATGHWAADGTFVNETANKVYDPETGEVNDVAPGQAGRVNPGGQRQEGVTSEKTIQQWGWVDRGNGDWFNPQTGERGRFLANGTFHNIGAGKVWDPASGVLSDYEAPAVRPGEFLERNPHRFNDPPPTEPFEYDSAEAGFTPFNEQFDWNYGLGDWEGYNENNPDNAYLEEHGWTHLGDGEWWNEGEQNYGGYIDGKFINKTQEVQFDPRTGQHTPFDMHGGYQPFGSEFAFDDTGYQPFGAEFEFDAEDLQKDPGYQWRLNQGNKAVERSAAAGGMLGSGKTLKGLQRWSQGLASQEYDRAYGRSLGEFGQRRDQTRAAYGRAWDEFGQRRDQTRAAYGRASNEYDRRYSQGLDDYGRAVQKWGLQYGSDTDSYNRSWDQFLNRQNQWESDQGNRWNRTLTTALLNSGGA